MNGQRTLVIKRSFSLTSSVPPEVNALFGVTERMLLRLRSMTHRLIADIVDPGLGISGGRRCTKSPTPNPLHQVHQAQNISKSFRGNFESVNNNMSNLKDNFIEDYARAGSDKSGKRKVHDTNAKPFIERNGDSFIGLVNTLCAYIHKI